MLNLHREYTVLHTSVYLGKNQKFILFMEMFFNKIHFFHEKIVFLHYLILFDFFHIDRQQT